MCVLVVSIFLCLTSNHTSAHDTVQVLSPNCTSNTLEVKVLSPEETLPGGKVSAFKEGVLQDALHTSQGLNHVCTVVVQVPKFAIVSLVSPPEWILLQHLQSDKTRPASDKCMLGAKAAFSITQNIAFIKLSRNVKWPTVTLCFFIRLNDKSDMMLHVILSRLST